MAHGTCCNNKCIAAIVSHYTFSIAMSVVIFGSSLIRQLFAGLCQDCNDLFQSKLALDYHREVKHCIEVKSFNCMDCTETFKTAHSVKVHKRSVHNRRDFYCRECFFQFKLHSHLLRHYRKVYKQ